MIIFGKERGFRFTVGASVEIAEMCPDGDLTKIEKFLSGKYGRVTRNGAKLIIELNKAYEMQRSFEDETYKPEPLTMAQLMALSAEQFTALMSEAMAAFEAGRKTTVEVEPSKKNEVSRPETE